MLLTQDNLSSRSQYQNAANTFMELLRYGAVPVVNENDTVAVEQLRFGDNDTLSAQVAALVHADWLFLMTDVDFLYTANPNTDLTAKPIYEVLDVVVPCIYVYVLCLYYNCCCVDSRTALRTAQVVDMNALAVDTSTKGTQWGTGGMVTKLTAARIATAAGCNMAICNSKDPRNIVGVLAGGRQGTVFRALPKTLRCVLVSVAAVVYGVIPAWMGAHQCDLVSDIQICSAHTYVYTCMRSLCRDRKRWILSMPLKGSLWLDAGAVAAVRDRQKSLFPAGIVCVEGDFSVHDAVRLCDAGGKEFARGVVNYSSEEVQQVKVRGAGLSICMQCHPRV